MVAHKWAHGNSGKGSNFYSPDGKRLISYGTDVAYNTGRGVVFISSDSMSPSTGRQISHARRACSHLDVVITPIFRYGGRLYDFDEKQAFNLACEALSVKVEGFSKARLGRYLLSEIDRAEAEVCRLAALAGKYGFAFPVVPSVPDEKREAARVYAEQWDRKDATRREAARVKEHARQAARREQDAAIFEEWHNGTPGIVQCPNSYRTDADGGYYIAVRGDKVVTSGGAECPIEHARAGIVFWKMQEHTGVEVREFTPWHRNGHRVQLGTFQLDRIEADGTAFAGCHKFTVAELDRLADILL